MPLPDPQLDDRQFQDIVNEAKALIPSYTPEWTDHNVSDPGVMLIEMFAWMTDLILYRLNRVPEKNYLRFMNLLGVTLKDPVPARTSVRFRLSAPPAGPIKIARGTEVATPRTGDTESIVFSTDEELVIAPTVLNSCLFSAEETTFVDYSPGLLQNGEFIEAFQEPPIPGNALYFAFQGNVSGYSLSLTLDCAVEGVGVDPHDPPLMWDAWAGDTRGWAPVEILSDGTGGLNVSGEVLFVMPGGLRERTIAGKVGTWLRLRVIQPRQRQPMYSASPRIARIVVRSVGGAVEATHSRLIRSEIIGRVTGTPGERFFLQNAPVLPRRDYEHLELEEPDGNWSQWVEVASFHDSQPDDLHYTIDSISGEVVFGPRIRSSDGSERAYGAVPPRGSAIRMTEYRTGGGIVGNIGQGSLTVLRSSVPFVAEVTNSRPATGGMDAESIESAKERAPRILQARNRAVTAEDYEFIALESSTRVGRARALPIRGDAGASAASPLGTVELLILPALSANEDRTVDALRPSADLLDVVREYLDARRLLGTHLVVDGPSFVGISTEVTIVVSRNAENQAVEAAVQARLIQYLDPLVGGADGHGWPFGRAVYLSELHAAIQTVAGVEYCQDLTLFQVDLQSGQARAAGQTITLGDDVLPLSVNHTVASARRRAGP
ncbi:MAG: putative baseplate assembly protein [Dehalococcoidia bacterium]